MLTAPAGFDSITELELPNTGITAVQPGVIGSLRNAQLIDLSNNNLSSAEVNQILAECVANL
jgi:hypothetical protein